MLNVFTIVFLFLTLDRLILKKENKSNLMILVVCLNLISEFSFGVESAKSCSNIFNVGTLPRLPRRVEFTPNFKVDSGSNELQEQLEKLPVQFIAPNPPPIKYLPRLFEWLPFVRKTIKASEQSKKFSINPLIFDRLFSIVESLPENSDVIFVGSNADHLVNAAKYFFQNTNQTKAFYPLRISNSLVNESLPILEQLVPANSNSDRTLILIDSMSEDREISDQSLFKLFKMVKAQYKKVIALGIVRAGQSDKDQSIFLDRVNSKVTSQSDLNNSLEAMETTQLGKLRCKRYSESEFYILNDASFWTDFLQPMLLGPRWNVGPGGRGGKNIRWVGETVPYSDDDPFMSSHYRGAMPEQHFIEGLNRRINWFDFQVNLLHQAEKSRADYLSKGKLEEKKGELIDRDQNQGLIELDGNYCSGNCNLDSNKLLGTLVKNYNRTISDFDVLALGYVTVNEREWVLHFAVLDNQNNQIFDPSYYGSNDLRGIPAAQYFREVANRHSSGQKSYIRRIDAFVYREFFDKYFASPSDSLIVFGQGLPERPNLKELPNQIKEKLQKAGLTEETKKFIGNIMMAHPFKAINNFEPTPPRQ